MKYADAYSRAISPMDNPEIGQLFHSAVGGFEGEADHTASLALADVLQDHDDWRQHIFAHPDTTPSGTVRSVHWTSSIPHGITKSRSTIGVEGNNIAIETHMPNHQGMYGLNPHRALLSREQYEDLRKDAATDHVIFPRHP